ncbi:sigma-E factor negative regulatory protein [Thiorhodovibrio frisius]|uniref:Negative regulator of sigma E activity n=1 Tax=Thiorhodovibrio frisius TaxID=631362 RepID=H8Z281_9GAMM|nr:sigma-E factor negative regulatory protein [Thiorhodovibrio frisius]EIC22643.1 negative regulator of sigma E activity [Thiorhodovibrio frisius]WPL22399.1 anti-RNA polymerase sigma factor SigE [Thiorhodovibrio frisius]
MHEQLPAEEELSILLDQDSDLSRVNAALTHLDQDAGLRARWGRYHLIRGALRGESVRADYHGIAARVSERLECDNPEQTHAATKAASMTEVAKTSGVSNWAIRGIGNIASVINGIGIGGRQNPGIKPPTTTRLALTGAALAGLAALGLTTLLPEGLPPESLPPVAVDPGNLPLVAAFPASLSPLAQSGAAGRRAASSEPRPESGIVSLPVGGFGAGEVAPRGASQPLLTSKLTHLLVGHQERVSASGIKGFLPYATLVGYQVQP